MKYGGSKDTVVQFLFYQPIRHQWRETDFFPCSATCGGGEVAIRQSTAALKKLSLCDFSNLVQVVIDPQCHLQVSVFTVIYCVMAAFLLQAIS